MSTFISGTAESSVPALTDSLEALYQLFPGKTADDIVTEQGRLFGRNVIRMTPNRTKGLGLKKVRKGVNRAVKLIGPKTFSSPGIRRSFKRARKTNNPQILIETLKHVPGLPDFFLDLEEYTDDIEGAHRAYLSAGGASSKTKRTAFTFNTAAFRQYVRSISDNVGMAKGGWAAGVFALGGKAPAWILRHKNQGQLIDGRKKPGRGSFVVFINHSSWASDKESKRIRNAAIQTTERNARLRAEHIIRSQLKKEERKLARAARLQLN